MMNTNINENKKIEETEKILTNRDLSTVSGGNRVAINQYDVQPGKMYYIYFPDVIDVIIPRPYGDRSGHTYRIQVYKVYEAKRTFGLGTNRTVDGIDVGNGEYVTVAINHDNIWEDR